MSVLESISRNIYPLEKRSMTKAKERLDNLLHPRESLGKMEDICIKLAGVYGSEKLAIPKKVVIAFASDHGVYEEGVANDPQSLTKFHIPNFVNGKSAVSVISDFTGADVVAVDVGINSDEKIEGVLDYKIRKGTDNMAKGSAMTRQEAVKALEIGIEVSEKCIVKDYRIIGIGEMGICNTTAATAIISVMTGADPLKITGTGATLPPEKVIHKAEVIKRAIDVNNPNPTDGIDVLAKVGGFEIGAMAGAILGCVANRIPVVLDGFISYAAAMIAYKINPRIKDYCIASHKSAEKGAKEAIDYLKLRPLLDMDMKLGEGSGAALAFGIIDASIYMYNNMGTFDEVDLGERSEVEKKKKAEKKHI